MTFNVFLLLFALHKLLVWITVPAKQTGCKYKETSDKVEQEPHPGLYSLPFWLNRPQLLCIKESCQCCLSQTTKPLPTTLEKTSPIRSEAGYSLLQAESQRIYMSSHWFLSGRFLYLCDCLDRSAVVWTIKQFPLCLPLPEGSQII